LQSKTGLEDYSLIEYHNGLLQEMALLASFSYMKFGKLKMRNGDMDEMPILWPHEKVIFE
jgi:hypothetical protein